MKKPKPDTKYSRGHEKRGAVVFEVNSYKNEVDAATDQIFSIIHQVLRAKH